MSIFEQVIEARKSAEIEKAHLKKVKIDAHEYAKETFKVEFINTWKTIVIPIFVSFVNDAKANGYDSIMHEFESNTSLYGGYIRLMPTKGTPLPRSKSKEVLIFAIGGEPYDQVVKLRFYCEMSPNWDESDEKLTGDLNIVNKENLENTFKAFLEVNLDSNTNCSTSIEPNRVVIDTRERDNAMAKIIRGW